MNVENGRAKVALLQTPSTSSVAELSVVSLSTHVIVHTNGAILD